MVPIVIEMKIHKPQIASGKNFTSQVRRVNVLLSTTTPIEWGSTLEANKKVAIATFSTFCDAKILLLAAKVRMVSYL